MRFNSLQLLGATTITVALAAYLYRRRRPNSKKLGLAARAHSIRGPTYSREGSRYGSSPLAALAIYPGSFNPPSRMHVDIAKRVSELPGIGAVWLDMTSHVDEKSYVERFLADRVRMAELAVADLPAVGVVQLMSAMGDAGQMVAYFDELRRRADGAPLAWVMGSDVVIGMEWWAAKARELLGRCSRVVIVQREHSEAYIKAALARVLQTPLASLGEHIEVTVLATHDDPSIASVSSSAIRRHLVALLDQVPHQVLQYVAARPKLLELYRDVEASTAARRQ